jgi:hypothetical protein
LRDLSNLQHRLGDYQGMSETRSRMMIASPIMINWISFLFSVYMTKNYNQTLEILDSIFDLYEKIEKKVPFEYSEVILFKANVLENMGEIKKAIKFVE